MKIKDSNKKASCDYRSVKTFKVKNTVVEMFEWWGDYYIRLSGTCDNFVDIYVFKDLKKSQKIYNELESLLEKVVENEN